MIRISEYKFEKRVTVKNVLDRDMDETIGFTVVCDECGEEIDPADGYYVVDGEYVCCRKCCGRALTSYACCAVEYAPEESVVAMMYENWQINEELARLVLANGSIQNSETDEPKLKIL